MMNTQNFDGLEPELQDAGRAVAQLSRSKAPKGLLERTLEHVALVKPLRRKILLLRPITHPLARVAAVAMLMTMVATAPLTDPETVDTVGRKIEYSVVGTRNVDRYESMLDGVLAKISSDGYSQNELDAVTGVYNTNRTMTRTRAAKIRVHSGV